MKTTILVLMIVLVKSSFAQNDVQYTCDAAGNRIQRFAISTWITTNNTPQEATEDAFNANIRE